MPPDKWKIYRGSPDSKSYPGGVLTSPNFPHGYALTGDIYTYYLENTKKSGGIRLVFDDWEVAPQSKILVSLLMRATATFHCFDRRCVAQETVEYVLLLW